MQVTMEIGKTEGVMVFLTRGSACLAPSPTQPSSLLIPNPKPEARKLNTRRDKGKGNDYSSGAMQTGVLCRKYTASL